MMRGLPPVEVGVETRVRRWDAVIVGSALPGLVAAARLGLRIVDVDHQDIPLDAFQGLRDRFREGAVGDQGLGLAVLQDKADGAGIERFLLGAAETMFDTSSEAMAISSSF